MANRKRKLLWVGGGVALAVVVLVILVLLFGVKTLKPRIEAAASKSLGMDVRIRGGVSVSLFPVFGASLADITATKGGADVASMANLRIGLKLLPLIRGRAEITKLELVKPVISILRQKNGKLNIEPPAGESSGSPLTVNKFAVSQGNIRFADLQSGGKIELDGIDISAADLFAGGAPAGDPLKTLSLTGDVRCRTIKAGNLTVTDLALKVTAGKGVYDVSQARMKVFGGAGSGTLHVDFTGAQPQAKITYALSRFKIEDLLQESPNAKKMEGLADFSADLTAKGKTDVEIKRALSGQVSLDGENILLNGVDIDGLLGSLERTQNFNLVDVGGYALAGPLGAALSRGSNFAGLYKDSQGGKGVITKLVSVWKVGRGVAEAVDVAMATKQHRIAVKGGLNFINDRFENVVVAVLDQRGCAVFSQKIHGPFSRPEIDKISTLKSLAGPLANLLGKGKKLIEPGPCVVFYSGSVAPPEHSKQP
jgi:uncharacterized protein involved in outer membrane biogenesis